MVNRTKIDWADYSWNPVTGCNNSCWYCYARRIANRFKGTDLYPQGFKPTFHEKRLGELGKIKKPSRIFVCSMADLFGDWITYDVIYKILDICKEYPQHRFLFLTKNPYRYLDIVFPENCWKGVTITGEVAYLHIKQILKPNENCFVSVEPFLNRVDHIVPPVKWLIIGAMERPCKRQPKKEWLNVLIDKAKAYDIPIFMKDNLDYPDNKRLTEFPEELEFEI